MPWFRQSTLEPLAVSMSGIKLGDRLLIVGCADTVLIAALAAKSGLTGRACMVCRSAEERVRAADAVEQQGVLVESFDAPPAALPFDDETFDVAVIRNVLPDLDAESRTNYVAEVRRVLRQGGRCMVIDDAPRRGIGALLGSGGRPDREFADSGGAAKVLTAAGFRGVRTLARRQALVFVEGVRPNTDPHPSSPA